MRAHAEFRRPDCRWLDDHVDAIPSNENVGVLGEERAVATQRVRQWFGLGALFRPPEPFGEFADAIDVEVGDPKDVQPRVRGACERNIDPNLPAPIRPRRTGFPASASAASFSAMLIVTPRSPLQTRAAFSPP
jgi:hypothetical protein